MYRFFITLWKRDGADVTEGKPLVFNNPLCVLIASPRGERSLHQGGERRKQLFYTRDWVFLHLCSTVDCDLVVAAYIRLLTGN